MIHFFVQNLLTKESVLRWFSIFFKATMKKFDNKAIMLQIIKGKGVLRKRFYFSLGIFGHNNRETKTCK